MSGLINFDSSKAVFFSFVVSGYQTGLQLAQKNYPVYKINKAL